MPIYGIQQPERLEIDKDLRLRRYDGKYQCARTWYRDENTVWMVDAVRAKYDEEQIRAMYRYQEEHNELYWIEKKNGPTWIPIGDVTLSRADIAIVIGDPSARGQGIGKKVINCLIQRARDLGWDTLYVQNIYEWNAASKALFTGLGFRPYEKTPEGYSYILSLDV